MTTDPAPTILVVDDEPAVRGLFVEWLSQAGYCCVEAGCAADAWIWLGRGPIHLVTLDITLSGRPGTELLPEIKQAFPDTEVLIITAHELAQSAITALAMGASGYLIKPVVTEELLLQVNTALERRQLLMDKRLYMQRLEDRVAEQTREICRAHEETMHRLVTAASHRDEETGAHIQRTGLLSEAPHHVETRGHILQIAMAAHPLQGDHERYIASGIDDYWSPARPLAPHVVLERWSAARNGNDAQRQNQFSESNYKSHATVYEGVTKTRLQMQRPLPRDVFDIEAMHALVENDLDLLAEMIELYLSSSPLLLTELESAVAAGDGKRVARAAHTLKGVLGNMCANTCEEAASQLEMMGTKDAFGGARQLLATLQCESQRLQCVLTEVAQGVDV